jgi:hypothetical protein
LILSLKMMAEGAMIEETQGHAEEGTEKRAQAQARQGLAIPECREGPLPAPHDEKDKSEADDCRADPDLGPGERIHVARAKLA